MLLLFAVLLLCLALAGGVAVHPILFLVAVVAVIVLVADRGRGVP